MKYVTLGRTGLHLSIAGLGCGGNSRIGMGTGKTQAPSLYDYALSEVAPVLLREKEKGKFRHSPRRQGGFHIREMSTCSPCTARQ